VGERVNAEHVPWATMPPILHAGPLLAGLRSGHRELRRRGRGLLDDAEQRLFRALPYYTRRDE